MAHGVNPMVKREIEIGNKQRNESVDGHQVVNPSRMGSRRMFTPQFKLQVLDSYRNDSDCKGNQRATARKYGIHRRQIQKWLQCEPNLRSSVVSSCTKTGQSVNQNQTTNPKPENGEVNFHLSLDVTRQSVALTSNKSNTGFLSPVHSHTIDYTPVSYEHIPPSASLPSSPVFTAPIEQHQQQQYDELREYGEYSVHFVDYVPQLQQQTPSTSIPPPTQHEQQFNENQITYNYESYYYDLSPMPVTPIDLSMRSRSRQNEFCKSRTPSPRACVWQNVESCQSAWQQSNNLSDDIHLVELTNVCHKAMDLSCRKRKATDDNSRSNRKAKRSDEWTSKPAKAIKLFKPYLDDDEDDGKKCKSEQRDPIIWSNYCENYSTYSCSPHYDCNSNIKESMYSYSSPPYPASTYICCSYGSPVSGYDSASSTYSTCSESGETKRSFDYTIDFKFQPIESYYGDLSCRGDERAVPHKYCMEISG